MNLPLLVLLLPAVSTAVLFLVPASKPAVVKRVAFVGTLATLAVAVFMALTYATTDAPTETAANGHVYKHVLSVPWVPSLGLQLKLGVDGIGVAMVLLTALTIFTGVCVSFSVKERAKEFFLNLLALVTGVFGVFVSLDLFFYYFFYELAVIPMFLLIGCWGSTTKTMSRDYASMKLVLMLTTGAVFALVGLLSVYVKAKTFDMVRLETLATQGLFDRSFQMTWFPPVFLGFAALVPMWPLHSWSPGGHAAAPAAVSMLHAGVLMKLGAYGILRVAVTYMPDAAAVYLPWVGVLCCFNIVYGGLVAMAQRDMKFVVGYSSSSHMGYVLLGIATANVIGVQGAVFLMFAHGIMTALAFSLIGFFYEQTHTRMLEDLGGLMKKLPFVGTCFVIMSMASAGLPGFANFVSELLVIVGAWHAGMYVPAVLATWGIVVTGVYLLRTVKDAFLGTMPRRWEGLVDARTPFQKLPFVVLVSTLLFFGFNPQALLTLISDGVKPIVSAVDAAKARTGGVETGSRR